MRLWPVPASAALVALAAMAPLADAASLDVHLRDHTFEPQTLTVAPGDSIVFYNDDKELHSVLTPDNEVLVAEHFVDPGTNYTVVIPSTLDPAIYDLVCTIHMNMTGTIRIIAR
jgi:plastocyanin